VFVRVIRKPQPSIPFHKGPGTPATIDYAMVRLTNTQHLTSVHDLFPTTTFNDPALANENILSALSNIATAQSVTAPARGAG